MRRRELNKAFGYKSDKELFYRSCFVFNALTENIITSPYDFLNFKFYAIEKDIAKLADILGHGSIETTRIYLTRSSKEQKLLLDEMVTW